MESKQFREWRNSPQTEAFFRALEAYRKERQAALAEWVLNSNEECHSPDWQRALTRESAKLEFADWLQSIADIDEIRIIEDYEDLDESEPGEY
jgi:hypothetical protein